jgi:hypothetical protein
MKSFNKNNMFHIDRSERILLFRSSSGEVIQYFMLCVSSNSSQETHLCLERNVKVDKNRSYANQRFLATTVARIPANQEQAIFFYSLSYLFNDTFWTAQVIQGRVGGCGRRP